MNRRYSVFVVPDHTTDGEPCYRAYHPELPGCMNHGTTIPEAVGGLNDARELYLATLKELGQPVPEPSIAPTMLIWRDESRSVPVQEVMVAPEAVLLQAANG